MAAKRLPNKPLLKINNKSLIMHVYERAKESKIGDVYVATCDKKIFYEIEKNNGKGCSSFSSLSMFDTHRPSWSLKIDVLSSDCSILLPLSCF